MKYVFHACSGTCGKSMHKLLGAGEGNSQVLQCDKCGTTTWREAPARTQSVKKRSWPYYNESAGVGFESESHEKAYVKKNNLEAL